MLKIAVISEGSQDEYEIHLDYIKCFCEYIGESVDSVTVFKSCLNDGDENPLFLGRNAYDLIFSLCKFPRVIRVNWKAKRNLKLMDIVKQWKKFATDSHTHILYEFKDELGFNVEQYMKIKGKTKRSMYDLGDVLGFK